MSFDDSDSEAHVNKVALSSQLVTDSVSKSFAVSQNLTETLGFVDDVSKSSAVSQNLTVSKLSL